MMKKLVLLVFFAGIVSAQQSIEVIVDIAGYVPVIKIQDPSFEKMCQDFATKLKTPKETILLGLRPKLPTSFNLEKNLGDEWIVSSEEKDIIVKASELPAILQKIKGVIVYNILIGSCYLHNRRFYSTKDVSFVVVGNKEARTIAAALRK